METAEKPKSNEKSKVPEKSPAQTTLPPAPAAPPMTSVVGEAKDYDIDAMYEADQKRRKDEALAAKAKMHEAYDCFVRCRYHGPGEPAHGIFLSFLPDPNEAVQMNQWRAGYKPTYEELFMNDQILCQVCLRRGEMSALDVVKVKTFNERTKMYVDRGAFEVSERALMVRAKDPKRLALEGELRLRDLNFKGSNDARTAAKARVQAAGMEWLLP